MKIGYFDCFSGAAGDMIVGAALDAGVSSDYLRNELGKLGLENVRVEIEKVIKKGISATSFVPKVSKSHHDKEDHHHRNLSMIVEIIKGADISQFVKRRSCEIFQRLARAEAKVHNTTEDKIHFHEVGADDTIIDVVGACVCLEKLGIEKLYCSPMVVGSGMVKCEHGILPVPAPATAELIKGIEILPSEAKFELLTPTGAAILTTLAERFGATPAMRISQIGYGAGHHDVPGAANVLRLMVGESGQDGQGADVDEICVLQANIDDATGELIGYVTEKLMEEGSLDVYCTSIMMKKNRPGTQITVLCKPGMASDMESILFRQSSSFGIRRHMCRRSILPRKHEAVETRYGTIRMKVGYFNGLEVTIAVEFGDCELAARKHNVTVKEVISASLAAYQK